jgi:multidrug resistance efflux pump
MSMLFASGDVSRARLDETETAVKAAAARTEVARQRLALTRAGARDEERAAVRERLRQRQAAYDLVRAGARSEEIAAAEAAVARVKADLQLIDVQLAEACITAPADATVTRVVAKAGEVIAPGQPLAILVDDGSHWVDLFVDETEIGGLAIGQAASLTFKSFPARTFRGRVASINETLVGEKQTKDSMNVRNVRVRVRLDGRNGSLRPGMSVEVRILTGNAS